MVNFNNDWDKILDGEFEKDYYLKLRQFLIEEYKTRKIFPSMYDIFNAMKLTAYDSVKCVIIGQDPCKSACPSPYPYRTPDRLRKDIFPHRGERNHTPIPRLRHT